MGGLSLADIAKWDPVAIGEVAQTAQKLAVGVTESAQPLANMPVFATWTGTAASSAQWAMRDSVEKAERFVGATKLVGGAASMAQAVIEGLVRALVDIRMRASAHGFRINDVAGTVEIAISTAHWSDEDFAQLKASQRELQARVDKLITEANHADDELARMLNKVADDGKKSIWAVDSKDVNSIVVGYLVGAKVDMLGDFGKALLKDTDSRLLPWLEEIGKLKISRVGIVGNVVMLIPAIIQDVGGGDSMTKAVTKEVGGTLAGIGAAAATGAVAGSVIPVGGTAIGAVGGVIIGTGVALLTTKGIGALFD